MNDPTPGPQSALGHRNRQRIKSITGPRATTTPPITIRSHCAEQLHEPVHIALHLARHSPATATSPTGQPTHPNRPAAESPHRGNLRAVNTFDETVFKSTATPHPPGVHIAIRPCIAATDANITPGAIPRRYPHGLRSAKPDPPDEPPDPASPGLLQTVPAVFGMTQGHQTMRPGHRPGRQSTSPSPPRRPGHRRGPRPRQHRQTPPGDTSPTPARRPRPHQGSTRSRDDTKHSLPKASYAQRIRTRHPEPTTINRFGTSDSPYT